MNVDKSPRPNELIIESPLYILMQKDQSALKKIVFEIS